MEEPAKSPDQKEIVVGKPTEEGADAEAGGRGTKSMLYVCFNCGGANYIPPDVTTFSCWRCGSHSEHSDP